MYKKQMKFQRFACYFMLAASALVFVYSLGLLTDLYDTMYSMMPDPDNMSLNYVAGTEIFYEMQDFNRALTKAGIALILISVFMMIMNTHTRRRYYIGNYVTIGLAIAGSLACSVWALKVIGDYKVQYLTTVDFESLKMWSEIFATEYTESTFWFDVSWFVFGIMLLAAAVLAANLIWKIKMTNEEKRLIAEGKEK